MGIDRRGVGEGETGELGGGESGDRVEEWGGRGRERRLTGVVWKGERVEIERRKSGWERERVGIGVG